MTTHGNKQTSSPLSPLQEILWLAFFCALIGVFVYIVRGAELGANLVQSEAIGFGIYATIKALIHLRGQDKTRLSNYLIGIPVGALFGAWLGAWLTGAPPTPERGEITIPLAAGVLFGAAIAYFFHSRAILAEQRQELEVEARKRSEQEKRLMESRLRLLQAQIEPHFLFNTLANVISLIDHDSVAAKKVLEELALFLRATLRRTRDNHATIADEIQLLDAWLRIQQVRMGKRLTYRIDCPDDLLEHPLPPLLVQPLVENALKHGLENSVEGGDIRIRFSATDGQLSISVADTGTGIQKSGNSSEKPTGLRNIRERLQALYGDSAVLSLRDNAPRGALAMLTLPLDPPTGETAT
ncbi:MAG TPA: sensor histidine kinase [Gammaproteobacteria bacterium]|nr:sensor histidine kinase [Gammaproteobacteria bacterium]